MTWDLAAWPGSLPIENWILGSYFYRGQDNELEGQTSELAETSEVLVNHFQK